MSEEEPTFNDVVAIMKQQQEQLTAMEEKMERLYVNVKHWVAHAGLCVSDAKVKRAPSPGGVNDEGIDDGK